MAEDFPTPEGQAQDEPQPLEPPDIDHDKEAAEHHGVIRKIRKIGENLIAYVAVAAIGAALQFTETVEWNELGLFGPGLGLVLAGGLDWLRGYFTHSDTKDFPS